MLYSSTRGNDNNIDFVQVMLNGLAKDGGLYVPNKVPKISKRKLQELKSLSYVCLLYTSPSPRDLSTSRMPSSA